MFPRGIVEVVVVVVVAVVVLLLLLLGLVLQYNPVQCSTVLERSCMEGRGSQNDSGESV